MANDQTHGGESNPIMRKRCSTVGEKLPSDADQDDVLEEARFRRAVEVAILAAD